MLNSYKIAESNDFFLFHETKRAGDVNDIEAEACLGSDSADAAQTHADSPKGIKLYNKGWIVCKVCFISS